MAREHLTTLHATPTLLRAVVRAMVPDQRFPTFAWSPPARAGHCSGRAFGRSHVSDTASS